MKKIDKLIRTKKAKIAIIGMGYVGLPLARLFSNNGFKVIGFDVDTKKITALNKGRSYIKHIPSKDIKKIRKNRFRASSDFRELNKTDIIIICVPTPLTKTRTPDLTFVTSTAKTIAKNLRKNQLIVLESTTYPGTTKEEVLPVLEKTGLKLGRDFYLAFSPEREDPGNPVYSTEKIPKVVGGLDKLSGKLACLLYSKIVKKVVAVSSARVAEATKLLENIYRCINIALVNELKVLFEKMDIDVWEVISAASTKPFGFHPFYPGPGLGGHCIPIDPFYLSWKAKQYNMPARFIELAGKVNISMPSYVIRKTIRALKKRNKSIKGAKILILGLAYKKDVDDMRESPSIELIEMLKEKGAKISYNDPHIPKFPILRRYKITMKSSKLTPSLLKTKDAVLISTDHSAYDYDWIVKHSRLVIDTRNATGKVKLNRQKIVRA